MVKFNMKPLSDEFTNEIQMRTAELEVTAGLNVADRGRANEEAKLALAGKVFVEMLSIRVRKSALRRKNKARRKQKHRRH